MNNLLNVEIKTDGTLRARRGYKTFSGLVWQLWMMNRRYQKLNVVADYTIRLPLKTGKFKYPVKFVPKREEN
jgi:hypothetical protein